MAGRTACYFATPTLIKRLKTPTEDQKKKVDLDHQKIIEKYTQLHKNKLLS